MASTDITPGRAVVLVDSDPLEDEALVGRVVHVYEDGDFDIQVTDRGSSIHGDVLTVFGAEIRSGSVRVMRIA